MEEETVPQAGPLQPAPERVQLTPDDVESLTTVAVKACALPVCMLVIEGETLTEIGGGTAIVRTAVNDLVGSVTEVALMFTVAGLGAEAGAA